MGMVSDLSMEFRATLGDIWSLCNHVEVSKSLYIGNWWCRTDLTCSPPPHVVQSHVRGYLEPVLPHGMFESPSYL